MSEPLTREERHELRRASSAPGYHALWDLIGRALNDLEAMEKKNKALLCEYAEDTDVLKADIERLEAERDTLRAQLESTAKVNASLCGELVDVRARCEQLEAALRDARGVLESCREDTIGTPSESFFASKVRTCDLALAKFSTIASEIPR